MSLITRRRFILSASAAAAAAFVYSRWGSGQRMRVAIVGAGGFGKVHVKEYLKRRDCQIAYICDADISVGRARVQAVFKRAGYKPKFVQDLRHVFDDPAVDVVSIAAPDHWHALAAIWAMQAGKDVYLEKPGSHSLDEIPLVLAAAAKHGRVCQLGLHQRSNQRLAEAIAYLHEGNLGEVQLALSLAYVRRKPIGPAGSFSPPRGLDYDLWCGPAARLPVVRKRFHYDWHWFWEYGTGGIGNNGVHRVDIARWGLGLEGLGESTLSFGGRLGPADAGETPNTQISLHRFGPKTIVQEVRGLSSPAHLNCKNGVIFHGSGGTMVCEKHKSTHFDHNGEIVRQFGDSPDFISGHIQNFLECVRARRPERLAAGLEKAADSARLCHLGNLSYRLGDTIAQDQLAERAVAGGYPEDVVKRTLSHLHKRAPGEKLVWGRPLPSSEAAPAIARAGPGTFKMPELKDI